MIRNATASTRHAPLLRPPVHPYQALPLLHAETAHTRALLEAEQIGPSVKVSTSEPTAKH